jgi:hypothetical protein
LSYGQKAGDVIVKLVSHRGARGNHAPTQNNREYLVKVGAKLAVSPNAVDLRKIINC